MDRRFRNAPAALSLAIVLVIAACGDSSPDEDVLAEVEYTSRPASSSAPPTDRLEYIEASVEGNTVHVDLTHDGDHCGIEPEASLVAMDGDLILSLRLVQRVDESACLAWVAETDVRATSISLPPGTYDVQARVEYPWGLVQYGRAGKVTIE